MAADNCVGPVSISDTSSYCKIVSNVSYPRDWMVKYVHRLGIWQAKDVSRLASYQYYDHTSLYVCVVCMSSEHKDIVQVSKSRNWKKYQKVHCHIPMQGQAMALVGDWFIMISFIKMLFAHDLYNKTGSIHIRNHFRPTEIMIIFNQCHAR